MAPKKRRGSGASKQKEKSKQRHAHASVIDDGDDADMEVCTVGDRRQRLSFKIVTF